MFISINNIHLLKVSVAPPIQAYQNHPLLRAPVTCDIHFLLLGLIWYSKAIEKIIVIVEPTLLDLAMSADKVLQSPQGDTLPSNPGQPVAARWLLAFSTCVFSPEKEHSHDSPSQKLQPTWWRPLDNTKLAAFVKTIDFLLHKLFCKGKYQEIQYFSLVVF